MLSVLVVSPHPSVPGGVSVFIDCMKRHVTRARLDGFYVGGDGRGGENPLRILWRLLSAPLRLIRRVRYEKPDLVHLNPSFDARSLIRDGLLLLALHAAGFRRVLFYIHGWDIDLSPRIAADSRLRRVTAWVLNKAALITVLGEDFRTALIGIGVDPARVVVTRTMFDGAGLLAAQRNLPPAAARRFILFMSRFDREKGGRELLQAFIALASDYPDLDLVMAGDGEDAATLHELAQASGVAARVAFPGYVGGVDKWRLLLGCAIFALPTYYRREGMPVAVLEAMGAGKPLLTGSAGALRSIIADPANGVVLGEVTAQTVEGGLRRLLSQPDFAAASAQANRAAAWSRFEARAVTAQIETYYRRVAAC